MRWPWQDPPKRVLPIALERTLLCEFEAADTVDCNIHTYRFTGCAVAGADMRTDTFKTVNGGRYRVFLERVDAGKGEEG